MSETHKLIGRIKVIEDTQTFSSGFQKREFVIEVPDGKYPQMVKFETVRDKIDLLNSLSIGDNVEVSFNIRGNEYNGKYYVSLNAWRIEALGGRTESNSPKQETPPKREPQPRQEEVPDDDESDCVPF
jgi:single-strand DNA-binding protein